MKVPAGYDEILEVYGQPCKVRTVAVVLPEPLGIVKDIHVNIAIAPAILEAFKKIHDGGHWNLLHDFGGCYCCRAIRGKKDKWSVHSWAAAIDLNTAYNPLAVEPPKTFDPEKPYVFTVDHPVVLAFKEQGALWGGMFHSRKDAMHFQFCTNY
jgi:hypothetical protein